MLVYLDTAHFIWFESAGPAERRDFLESWRDHGCELAVSLQLLQEGVKHGSPEKLDERLRTMRALGPMRGMPAGSAGVMVREAAVQMLELLGEPLHDPIGASVEELFPPLEPGMLVREAWRVAQGLQNLNAAGEASAGLEAILKARGPIKKGAKIDPQELRRGLESSLGLKDLPEFVRGIHEGAIRNLERTDGIASDALVLGFGLEKAACLGDLRDEDLSKASGFLEAGKAAAIKVADRRAISVQQVRTLVDELRPYAAPGYSLEMAVSRARRSHNAEPAASDFVDEEHVCFAPYVDLLMVDKRTQDFLHRELRRGDGRIVEGAADSIRRPRSLDDIVKMIEGAAGHGTGKE